MILQNIIFIITLIGIGLVTLGFAYVISQAGKPADDEATRKANHTSNVFRRWLFGALLVLFVGGTYGTLRNFPIPPPYAPLNAKQVVDVVGQQWAWKIQTNKIGRASGREKGGKTV